MDNIVKDDEDFNGGKRPPAILINLPDELAEWADQNHELIRRVQGALTDSYASLSEDQIWEVIATTCDPRPPQWQEARENLRSAEKIWDNLNSPMNASLGAIGQALDSHETDDAKKHFDLSLSDFTIINEGLRQRPDLSTLLNVLLVQKRMLDQSTDRTHQAQQSTIELADMTSLRDDFRRAARKPSRIQRQFRAYTQRLLAPRKPVSPMNVIVPWLPGT